MPNQSDPKIYKEATTLQIGIHAIFTSLDGPRGLLECTELHTSCDVLVVVEASAIVPLLLDFIMEVEIIDCVYTGILLCFGFGTKVLQRVEFDFRGTWFVVLRASSELVIFISF